MKLAIVVVYIVEESHGGLLDLHLARIERHTSMPWTIYGSTNRLLPRFRAELERHPAMKLVELPATELRSTPEHAYYLERLIRVAIDDGASHVATLHVDSFPIVDGWDERLAKAARDPIAFATIDHINTACLFFPREFYLTHRPTLLVPGDERSGTAWEAYLREYAQVNHTGIGYGFAAHRAGLQWLSMPGSTTRPGAPRIFGDMLVHVGGALRLRRHAGQSSPLLRQVGYRRAEAMSRATGAVFDAARAITPRPLRALLRRLRPQKVEEALDVSSKRLQADLMAIEIERMLADPDGYLAALHSAPR